MAKSLQIPSLLVVMPEFHHEDISRLYIFGNNIPMTVIPETIRSQASVGLIADCNSVKILKQVLPPASEIAYGIIRI